MTINHPNPEGGDLMFAVGTVVREKGREDKMTVIGVRTSDWRIECHWIDDDGAMHKEWLQEEQLELVPDEETESPN